MSLTKVTYSMISNASVNVMDFGAKGDGTTNDTAAIQAAITYAESTATPPSAAPGVVQVYFPFGIYIISSALTVTKSLSFVGEGHSEYSTGARIIQNTSATDHFKVQPISAGCSVSWDSLTMTANGGGGTGGACINITKTTSACNSVRIRGCTFGTPQSLAIKIQGSDDIQIDGNLFDVSSTNCISLGTSTATDIVSNCVVSNNAFFQISSKIFTLYNVNNLIVSNNRVYPNPGSSNAEYFIDGNNTLPYQLKDIVVQGNTITNVNCVADLKGVENFVFSSNSCTSIGKGSGATLSAIQFEGAPKNISVTGNVFSGSFDTKSFYDDSGVSSPIANANISGNLFTNTAGTGRAIQCANTAGVISGNTFYGFASYSVSESVQTSGSVFTPGTITTLSSYTQNVALTGVLQGDLITVSSPYTVWPLPVGIQMVAYVSAPGVITFKYENVTSGSIAVTAHDWIYTVTRSL